MMSLDNLLEESSDEEQTLAYNNQSEAPKPAKRHTINSASWHNLQKNDSAFEVLNKLFSSTEEDAASEFGLILRRRHTIGPASHTYLHQLGSFVAIDLEPSLNKRKSMSDIEQGEENEAKHRKSLSERIEEEHPTTPRQSTSKRLSISSKRVSWSPETLPVNRTSLRNSIEKDKMAVGASPTPPAAAEGSAVGPRFLETWEHSSIFDPASWGMRLQTLEYEAPSAWIPSSDQPWPYGGQPQQQPWSLMPNPQAQQHWPHFEDGYTQTIPASFVPPMPIPQMQPMPVPQMQPMPVPQMQPMPQMPPVPQMPQIPQMQPVAVQQMPQMQLQAAAAPPMQPMQVSQPMVQMVPTLQVMGPGGVQMVMMNGPVTWMPVLPQPTQQGLPAPQQPAAPVMSPSPVETVVPRHSQPAESSLAFGQLFSLATLPQQSRQLQADLSRATDVQLKQACEELAPRLRELAVHRHGNYVVSKLSTMPQFHNALIAAFQHHVVDLIKHAQGSRVVQATLAAVPATLSAPLIGELCGHVYECAVDTHGSWGIVAAFKCSHSVPLLTEIISHLVPLSTLQDGIRAVQGVLEEAAVAGMDISAAAEAILASGCAVALATNPFANYAVQVALRSSKPALRNRLVEVLLADMQAISSSKHGSNVAEQVLPLATPQQLESLRLRIFCDGDSDMPLLKEMLSSPFGNYVVQAFLRMLSPQLRAVSLSAVQKATTAENFGKTVLTHVAASA